MLKSIFTSKLAVSSLKSPVAGALLTAASLLVCFSCMGSVRGGEGFGRYSTYNVTAFSPNDEGDDKWADYLAKHLRKRADNPLLVRTMMPTDSGLKLVVDLNPAMAHDYKIAYQGNTLRLAAKSKRTMVWLIYQFINCAAQTDSRIDSADLPPATIKMENAERDFDFEWRGMYSPYGINSDLMGIGGYSNVDSDWGLWGHNLKKLLPGGKMTTEMCALSAGKRTSEQFCFSSENLYRVVEAYITEQYGKGGGDEAANFAIMPNDNDIVCQCPLCRAAGNIPGDASPAVCNFVARLARKFPGHRFFTSSYLSTRQAPRKSLPRNTGVLVSAIDIPMQAGATRGKSADDFARNVKEWERAVGKVYVWDYVRNFDDYLTPYPCLKLIKERFRFFKRLGIKGVFLNSSGEDYSTFDGADTYCQAALLQNLSVPLDSLMPRCLQRYFPETGGIIADYYQRIVDRAVARRQVLPFYGGIADAKRAWLDAGEFENFVAKLDAASKQVDTDSPERALLNKLLTGLQFTRLELLRSGSSHIDAVKSRECLAILSGHSAFKEMDNYREAAGPIDDYISQWESLLPLSKQWRDNPLRGVKAASNCPADEDGCSPLSLTDGRLGIPSDYHTAWFIMTKESPTITLTIPRQMGEGKTLTLSFLNAPRWRIYHPASVELWQGGKFIADGIFEVPEGEAFSRVMANVPLSGVKPGLPVEFRIRQSDFEKQAKAACDEMVIR